MKYLIKNNELYNSEIIHNGYEEDFYECYKNPTSNEWNNIVKLKHGVRGIITKNDVYIWDAELLHFQAIPNFSLEDGIHFDASNSSSIGLYLIASINPENFKTYIENATSLYNYFSNDTKVNYVDTRTYGADDYKEYHLIKTINDIINLEAKQKMYLGTLKRLIKKSEFYNATQYDEETYIECFKNPTIKEWKESADQYGIKGLINYNGDVYIWKSSLLHMDAIKDFGLQDGIHFDCEYGPNSIYIHMIESSTPEQLQNAFKNGKALYNYLTLNTKVERINTYYYDAERYNMYDDVATIQGIINYNLEDLQKIAQ